MGWPSINSGSGIYGVWNEYNKIKNFKDSIPLLEPELPKPALAGEYTGTPGVVMKSPDPITDQPLMTIEDFSTQSKGFAPSTNSKGLMGLWDKYQTKKKEEGIYDSMLNSSRNLGIMEGVAQLGAITQSLFAKSPTVTRPKNVALTTPKIVSGTAAAQSLINENANIAINTTLERDKQTGNYSKRNSVGIMGQVLRGTREAAYTLTQNEQNLINQSSAMNADIKNKETSINAEINNQYVARRDQILAEDSKMRSMQLSGAVSNIGGIFSRMMNEKLMINSLEQNADRNFINSILYPGYSNTNYEDDNYTV